MQTLTRTQAYVVATMVATSGVQATKHRLHGNTVALAWLAQIAPLYGKLNGFVPAKVVALLNKQYP